MQPKERAEEVRVCAAGYAQVYGGLASDGDSGRGCHGSAVVMERIAVRVKPTADRFSRLVGVLAGETGYNWFRSRCSPRWVPLLPTYDIVTTVWLGSSCLMSRGGTGEETAATQT